MNSEKVIGESLDLPKDVLDYADRVATGREFGKTPSTARYKNQDEYFNEGSEEDKAIKKAFFDQYNLTPEPERLHQFKQADEIYSKAIGNTEEDHFSLEQAVDAAIAEDVTLELSTILGATVQNGLLYSKLYSNPSERSLVERGLYNDDTSAINRMKDAQFGYSEEEKTKRGEIVMQCVELRKALFNRIKEQQSSGYDSLAEEVPFDRNTRD